MNPETEGTEEQGPNRVPFVNDPGKPANGKLGGNAWAGQGPEAVDEDEDEDEEEEESGLPD